MGQNRYVVGADIGGSHICAAVVDLKTGALSGEPVSIPVDSSARATEILDAWAQGIGTAVRQSGIPYFQPAMLQQFSHDGRQIQVHTSRVLDMAAMIGAASLFL